MAVEQLFFQRKTDGTGSALGSPVQIGRLPGTGLHSYVQGEYRAEVQDGLIRWVCRVPVIPMEPNDASYDIAAMRDAVNAYVSSALTDMQFAPVETVTLPNGKRYVRTRRQQRGDLYVKTFDSERVIVSNVAIAEANIVDGEPMHAGGMVVEFVFVQEHASALPSQRWCSFRIRAGGTGSQQSRVNLVDSGTQSSRLTVFDRQQDGIIQRFIVRTTYSAENGARSMAQVLSHLGSQQAAMVYAQPILRTNGKGQGLFLNVHDNFGDVTLDDAYNGSTVTTLIQNVTLESARVVDSDEQGGVTVEYAFVNVRPEFTPEARYFRFRMKSASGSHKKTVPLGIDDPESSWLGELEYFGRDKLTLARVRVWMPNDHGDTTLLNIQAKAEGIRNDCEFKPPLVKDLPRGFAYMPNVHTNFGDLYVHTSYVSSSSTSGTVVLSDCCMMEPPRVFDSLNDGGVGMEFVFGRVADSSAIE